MCIGDSKERARPTPVPLYSPGVVMLIVISVATTAPASRTTNGSSISIWCVRTMENR